jgi:hypothetical protein
MLTVSTLGVLYLGGCVTWSPAEAVGHTKTEEPAKMEETFARALKRCRLKEPGRMNRRLKTPATEPHVRRCLEARGWLPNGTAVSNETDISTTEAKDIER